MTLKTVRKSCRWLAVAAILAIPPELAAIDAIRDADKSLPQRWLSRLDANGRQAAMSHLASLPVSFRMALLGSSAPAEQAAAWRGVAERFRAARPNLSAAQSAAIDRVIVLATTETFATRNATVVRTVKDASKTIEDVFGREAMRELFMTAGPAIPESDVRGLPLSVQFHKFVRTHLIASAALAPDCNCRMPSDPDHCGSGNYCSESMGCDFLYFGCGIWSLEYCNGYCLPIPPA